MRRSSWTGMVLFAIGFAVCLSYFRAARSPEPSADRESAPLQGRGVGTPATLEPADSLPRSSSTSTQVATAAAPPAPDIAKPGAVEKWVSVLSNDQSDQSRRLAVASLRELAQREGDENHSIRDALRRVIDDGTEVAPAAQAAFDEIERDQLKIASTRSQDQYAATEPMQ